MKEVEVSVINVKESVPKNERKKKKKKSRRDWI